MIILFKIETQILKKKIENLFITIFLYIYNNSSNNTQAKNVKKKKIEKTHDLFISPKQKNTILEMCLKSSIMSKQTPFLKKSFILDAQRQRSLIFQV